MKSPIIALSLIVATISTIYFYPSVNANPIKHQAISPPEQISEPSPNTIVYPVISNKHQKKIEVVFVLDTTGSMSGLIQTAKNKIWSIASTMASAQPAPIIKMGLVAYRDRGDDYITRVVDLSDDLDTNYGTLMSFQAGGGGDNPESVNKALYDAVNNMSWSQDDNTYRVIFLVGDAPPQTQYKDEMQFPEIIELAQSKGIIVNTIQCGDMTVTTKPWKQIAKLGQGDFFQVDQAGGAVAVTSPFDDKIAELSRELDDTRLFYGDKKTKETKRRKVLASNSFNREASSSAIARKAEFNVSSSGHRNFVGENELVDAISTGSVKLDSIQRNELPDELQDLNHAEQAKVIKDKAQKRAELKQQISALSKKRSDYVLGAIAQSGADKDSLDNQIYQSVKSQAKEIGLEYSDEAPKY